MSLDSECSDGSARHTPAPTGAEQLLLLARSQNRLGFLSATWAAGDNCNLCQAQGQGGVERRNKLQRHLYLFTATNFQHQQCWMKKRQRHSEADKKDIKYYLKIIYCLPLPPKIRYIFIWWHHFYSFWAWRIQVSM